MIRTFSDLRSMSSLEERYDYLRLGSIIGETTFGSERFLNQGFYRSREWKDARDVAIARDLGNDLGVFDRPIRGDCFVHHMNPLTMTDIEEASKNLFDPEGLICASMQTHNAIHFGNESQLPKMTFVERRPGDTQLW